MFMSNQRKKEVVNTGGSKGGYRGGSKGGNRGGGEKSRGGRRTTRRE